jgi:hypothetical protein
MIIQFGQSIAKSADSSDYYSEVELAILAIMREAGKPTGQYLETVL